MKSKTQQALDLMREDPALTAYAAAQRVGLTEQAVYQAKKRAEGKQLCPCCGQVVRKGFEVKK